MPLRWPRRTLTWGRRVGPLVAQGYNRSFTWQVERCQGGVAGGVPPHKGGPERPDRPKCSGQWPVVGGQELRGSDMAPYLPEVLESVILFGLHPRVGGLPAARRADFDL